MNLPMPPRLYDRVRRVMTPEEWAPRESTVDAILRLKQERNAVILAHNYQTPDIYHCVSDIVGDSLALARRAAESDADVILVAGVHFMAETAKLLNPDRTVLMPDPRAGCSLAESITAADVRALKEKYPGVPVVTYVNTSAEVKAECDICCTSSNAVRVVESLGVDRVLLVPDEFLARNVARQTDVEIIPWTGRCEVHERFTPEEIARYRATTDNLVVLAHPECAPEVVAAADHAGSTADMIRFVKERRPDAVMMVTECSMSDNVAAEVPDVTFVRPCNLCPHMKLITLDNIHRALETLTPKVEIPADIARRARQSVERMIAIS